ncbi:MAG TPA: lysophospholipid acyltransferase family protein [Bryobacteraceae bacterium]|nr:lysophospholipid acyltransferase family protein [Bryobacteraceae bacterium]
MRKRSAVRDVVEYAAALCVVKSLEWTPLWVANRLGRFYANLLDASIPRLRRVAMRNLSLAMPRVDESRRREIADEVFGSIARVIVAFARFPSLRRETLDRWIRCEGTEYVDEAFARGRGVLFATAHFGNWELSAFAHALFRAPMHVVVRPLDNPYIDRLVERRRGLTGNRPIFKKDSARAILKALAANEAVGILIDQNVTADAGVFVDFFGLSACASTGLAKLAAHSGAAVIPGFAVWREAERRYVLRFYPPVAITGDARRDTQELQEKLEEAIREDPGQWLWIHRRWKTRPAGEAGIY